MTKIEFVLNNLPDNYNKNTNSNIYRILNAFSMELDKFLVEMDKVKNSRFVDYASGNDLDKIGSILSLKRLNNENDDTYRGRIKARIPSFIGGGTTYAIRQVVRNFLGVEATVIEHYRTPHVFFHNGVLHGLDIEKNLNNFRIKSGISYIDGTRITSEDFNLSTEYELIDENNFIFMDINGNIQIRSENQYDSETEIPLYYYDGSEIEDLRFMLNPDEHYITNTATITVQIPYNFSESNIKFEDFKNTLKRTKAAGIAMLIEISGLLNDYIQFNELVDTSFIVGFSNIGSSNYIGGQP